MDLESRGIVPICVVKTKALISFAVTVKLICAFVFAYADCWFSHGVAQMASALIIFSFRAELSLSDTSLQKLKIIITISAMLYFFKSQVIQLYQKKKGYFEFDNLIEWIIFIFAIIVTIDFTPCSDATGYRYVRTFFTSFGKTQFKSL